MCRKRCAHCTRRSSSAPLTFSRSGRSGRRPDEQRKAMRLPPPRMADVAIRAPPGGRQGVTRMRVAVVGATGVVGRTMLRLLRERSFPATKTVAFASERSAGAEVDGLTVRALDDRADLDGFDIALFSAGAGTSREWASRF